MAQEFRIGCSGYYYSFWKPGFYPKEISQKKWLNYYSTVFNTVELNATFYRVPGLNSLKKNAEVVTEDFLFSAKMSRYITHLVKLKNCRKEIDEFQDLLMNGLKEKMGCFLFQMPPSFHYNEENLDRILTQVPRGEQNVVELRHISWWNENTAKQFKKAGITFCNIDYPGIKTQIINTGKNFYMRFHGTPVLFHSAYSQERLKTFIHNFPLTTKRNFIYFNNTDLGNAYKNAGDLMKLLKVDRSQYIFND